MSWTQGPGTGSLAELFRQKIRVDPICIEIDPTLCSIIESKNFECFNDISKIIQKFDAIYSSNVLEHIPEDVEAIRNLHSLLKPHGRIGIYVPAFMCLFSDMDRTVGHIRRYSKKEIQTKLELSKFKIVHIEYVDSLGFLATTAIKILGWKNNVNIGGNKSLKIYDTFIFPVSKLLDKFGFKYLFGKNILIIAEVD